MDEDLRINRIRPYKPEGDGAGRSGRRRRGETAEEAGEEDEEEQNRSDGSGNGEPEVTDGHIDTRVSGWETPN